MSESIAGIDPHQGTFTIGIVDPVGVEVHVESFDNSGVGYLAAVDVLTAHGVRRVGIEGSASWGVHVAVALVAGGFDTREVPPSRTAAQRRSRRLDKTDAVDAVSTARALQAEPGLGPVQALDAYDPLVAKIEAVLEHHQALVAARTLLLHHIGDQISKLPPELRDQLTPTGKIESRLRRLESIVVTGSTTPAGDYRLAWLLEFVDQDRAARRERSAALSGSSTGCSMTTERPCGRNPASARSQLRRCCARSATRPGSRPNRSSLAGAAPALSRSRRPRATASQHAIAWTSEATER